MVVVSGGWGWIVVNVVIVTQSHPKSQLEASAAAGVAPPPAPAKHAARLVHWGQHQQRTAVVAPGVVTVHIRVKLVRRRLMR